MSMLENLPALQQYGFQFLTKWTLRNGKIKPQELGWDNCSGWIYAFVTDQSVRYIGIATTVLRSRLDGYSYQTSDRVGALIGEALGRGADVKIFGVKRAGVSKQDLEKEESALIQDFASDWNVRQ